MCRENSCQGGPRVERVIGMTFRVSTLEAHEDGGRSQGHQDCGGGRDGAHPFPHHWRRGADRLHIFGLFLCPRRSCVHRDERQFRDALRGNPSGGGGPRHGRASLRESGGAPGARDCAARREYGDCVCFLAPHVIVCLWHSFSLHFTHIE